MLKYNYKVHSSGSTLHVAAANANQTMNMLSEQDTKAVNSVLIELLGVSEGQLTSDARFDEDLGADSLSRVEIALSLEERFNLSIPDEKWDGVETVGDLYETMADLLYKSKERG